MADIHCFPRVNSVALPLCFPWVVGFTPLAAIPVIKRSGGFSCISLTRRKTSACARDESSGKFQKKSKTGGIDDGLRVLDRHDVAGSSYVEGISESTDSSGKVLGHQTGRSDCGGEAVVSVQSFWHNGAEEDGNLSDSSQTTQSSTSGSSASSTDSLSLGIKEPSFEVIEVKPNGIALKKDISRRQLLKSGLRLRDIRSVDPSLWVTNSVPSLLVREQAILLNLGSLRAIAMPDNVLVFDHRRALFYGVASLNKNGIRAWWRMKEPLPVVKQALKQLCLGGQAFLECLVPRLNPKSTNGAPTMPFELEVVEAALISRTQRLERMLMEVEPRVVALLKVLPNLLTANILEQLRLSKQSLVELASKAGALRQMLLDLLEHPTEIRRMTVLGRNCIVRKDDGSVQCSIPLDKTIVEEEEEEIEMLLENYLQRCECCHGQAERLLDSAKEMEDSIAVNLSSRRLEVSKFELVLQVGTFCTALGALIAGIFGMNLKSYLEERMFAFWMTTAGIILGGIALFIIMYSYLKGRKIL